MMRFIPLVLCAFLLAGCAIHAGESVPMLEPTSATTAPTTAPTEPSTVTTQPTSRSTMPPTEDTELTDDDPEPITEATEAITEATEPTTEATEATTEATEATTEATEATTETTAPTVEGATTATEATTATGATTATEPTTATAAQATGMRIYIIDGVGNPVSGVVLTGSPYPAETEGDVPDTAFQLGPSGADGVILWENVTPGTYTLYGSKGNKNISYSFVMPESQAVVEMWAVFE